MTIPLRKEIASEINFSQIFVIQYQYPIKLVLQMEILQIVSIFIMFFF